MPEITTAGLALVISVLVALWNLVKYLLEGGRVRVTMSPGLQDEYSLAQAGSWSSLRDRSAHRGGWTVEVAVIKVENIGRTAVTISDVSLALRAQPWWRQRNKPWWRPKRYTIVPIARQAPGGASLDPTRRLEPFDSATFVYDVWHALDSKSRHPESPARPFAIRASIRVAGKRWARHSPWRRRWRVTAGQVAFIPERAEIGMLAYRIMSRYARGDMYAEMACIPTAIDVRAEFPLTGPAPTRQVLAQIVERHYFGEEKSAAQIIAFHMSQDLRRLYGNDQAVESRDAGQEPAA
ncbi:UNVERIFIED_ORG: hypothetical protein E4P37_03415 [Bacillus sp. AZ43]